MSGVMRHSLSTGNSKHSRASHDRKWESTGQHATRETSPRRAAYTCQKRPTTCSGQYMELEHTAKGIMQHNYLPPLTQP